MMVMVMVVVVVMHFLSLGGERSGGDSEDESGGDEKLLDHGREPCRWIEPIREGDFNLPEGE